MIVFATLSLFHWIIILVFWVLSSIAFFRLAKLSRNEGIAWFAWIPVLAQILQLRMIGRSGWWVLMYLIPIANLVFAIYWRVKLLNAFGKHSAFVLFYIFLTPVYLILWMVWACSSDTKYVGD